MIYIYHLDNEIFHDVTLDLVSNIIFESNSWQSSAFLAAKSMYTDNFNIDDWNNQIKIVAKNLSEHESPSNRLLWCSLNMNTGLDAYEGEFLALTANAAGVSSSKIWDVFLARVASAQND